MNRDDMMSEDFDDLCGEALQGVLVLCNFLDDLGRKLSYHLYIFTAMYGNGSIPWHDLPLGIRNFILETGWAQCECLAFSKSLERVMLARGQLIGEEM